MFGGLGDGDGLWATPWQPSPKHPFFFLKKFKKKRENFVFCFNFLIEK
jgi:hypothetical protein